MFQPSTGSSSGGNKKIIIFEIFFQALEQAAGMSIQVLHSRHVEVWQQLWTTGFGISHSYADNAINGAQVIMFFKSS